MKIFFAGDHAGFELKKDLMEYVKSLGYEVEDLGPFSYNAGDDYPDYVTPLANRVVETGFGIIIGGSGQGEAMCANRVKSVRAAVYYSGDIDVVKKAREHNDANILSLGARFVSKEDAKAAVKFFLETPFSGDERHIRRIKEIDFV
ncbi:MAG: ribose-5-phosphate isomerase [Candidatus Taylorbacteria bacterium RIFCSPHIGHO2_02_FULL_47_18]|uniref:Ribose-5-phosphate isomerase n=1 Tax=Candidatus Taylorbacteria bacterium RIFCSPLOWO2_01_FULL_48_100 TaxID=1802322 RepID=A0A1G2NG38_9BACT|nr:MAG: ribose-5-phosphate isomerase [Candidatus Taylorbacteria bacterium RIFCSPHIGHO2_02_FULL_47_18]OHA35048.1 MAG: ribose-5-phosphate isomerase [Candidatus Taylorbacteria bacterium RIFCSPLOWO2_01_FULL_48_100]OHA40625.1 MAG: ribose-5-phosphate isomerase [Candidatus Taylorbacteria bacterium RIFCSPLOWO2_02_FULL_48_16]OHA44855.1 MAG: ribose-5-phosphate isomerase [Candidatus Taylorbacteria bacterium RIFCSPLOWO2_12_FULL_48_11]